MKGIISLAIRLLERIRISIHKQKRLKELRAANPTCSISSVTSNDVKIGKYAAILDGVRLQRVTLGNFSYISSNSSLINAVIGNFCSIGPHVQVGYFPHPSRIFVSTYPAFYSGSNEGCPKSFREDNIFDDSVPATSIGNDVWIGSNVIIPGGIQIGTGAIVAAGSVVVKDVPPYAVVGGNPAMVIRHRFSEDQIELLLASAWWSWPIEKIIQNVDAFSDFEKFKTVMNSNS